MGAIRKQALRTMAGRSGVHNCGVHLAFVKSAAAIALLGFAGASAAFGQAPTTPRPSVAIDAERLALPVRPPHVDALPLQRALVAPSLAMPVRKQIALSLPAVPVRAAEPQGQAGSPAVATVSVASVRVTANGHPDAATAYHVAAPPLNGPALRIPTAARTLEDVAGAAPVDPTGRAGSPEATEAARVGPPIPAQAQAQAQAEAQPQAQAALAQPAAPPLQPAVQAEDGAVRNAQPLGPQQNQPQSHRQTLAATNAPDASITAAALVPATAPTRTPDEAFSLSALPGKGLRPKPDLAALELASVSPVNGLQTGDRPRVSRAVRLTEIGDLEQKLARKGFSLGQHVLVRIFKETSEFEVWLEKDGRLELFRNYRICRWSGGLGPKLREGDRQSPEGFYAIERWQLRSHSRNHRAIDVGFPNALDRARGLTGTHIQIHGGCGSEGCFAMTDLYIEEIYDLMFAAFRNGQQRVGVHIYPFRMTTENMVRHANNKWMAFWRTLVPAHEYFAANRSVADVQVCGKDYALGGDKKCVAPWHRQRARIIASRKRALRAPRTAQNTPKVRCNLRLPSCRRWLALAKRRAQRGRVAVGRASSGGRASRSRIARR